MEYSTSVENENFKSWKNRLSTKILQNTGVHPDDLPDFYYRNYYDQDYNIENTYSAFKLKYKNTDFYNYWFKYISNGYSKSKTVEIDNQEPFIKMYEKRISCYEVLDGLISTD
jgi:hypothetical protein